MAHTTYCRICPGICGLVVEIEDNRVVGLRGDPDNPLTGGFTCSKGRALGRFHEDPNRIVEAQRRRPDGGYEPIDVQDAAHEIAARIEALVAEHGPDSVAFVPGTQASMSSLTLAFARGWFRTIGSESFFSPATIDQSAKWVAEGRLGSWAGGRQRFADADVWMLVGTNPLLTMQGGDFTGFPIHNGSARLSAELRRGLRLIVVDPRRTEVASRAMLHLQLIPGTDALLFAGLLHVILAEGLQDQEFCDRWVTGLDDLRQAVAHLTPDVVGAGCGLAPAAIVEAARVFGRAGRGMAMSGTGPDMGPNANLAEHLIQAMNVVCGRFPREGDAQAEGGVLGAGRPRPAEAISPDRAWERGYRDPSGHGKIKGELPFVTLPDRMLSEGPDRIRALVAVGTNPASCLPDQVKTVRGLSRLDLLVTLEPFWTDTALLSHYVIAPRLNLERPDTTRSYEGLFDPPFAQYTPALLEPPPGTIEDWEFMLRLTRAAGRSVTVAGVTYGPDDPVPTSDEVLASFTRRARIPLEEVRRHPHGRIFEEVEPVRVGPPSPGASGRFSLLPVDVARELASLDIGLPSVRLPLLLVVRRMRDTLNSLGTRLPGLSRHATNACFLHPDDLEALGLTEGEPVSVTSEHGSVLAVTASDRTLRPGVVSMTHGFGALPGSGADPLRVGVNMGRLTSLDTDLQDISAMPRLSALPVAIARHVPPPPA